MSEHLLQKLVLTASLILPMLDSPTSSILPCKTVQPLKHWDLMASSKERTLIISTISGKSLRSSVVHLFIFFNRWKPFDSSRNWPDLGPRFIAGENVARAAAVGAPEGETIEEWEDRVLDDKRDLDWATVLKRTFEGYIRGERPNMYGEWIEW
jgi:hypothetical protein